MQKQQENPNHILDCNLGYACTTNVWWFCTNTHTSIHAPNRDTIRPAAMGEKHWRPRRKSPVLQHRPLLRTKIPDWYGSWSQCGTTFAHTLENLVQRSQLASFQQYHNPYTYITCSLTLNLGLQSTFRWVFIIADVCKSILDADFLKRYSLSLNMKSHRLMYRKVFRVSFSYPHRTSKIFWKWKIPHSRLREKLAGSLFWMCLIDCIFYSKYISVVDPLNDA